MSVINRKDPANIQSDNKEPRCKQRLLVDFQEENSCFLARSIAL